MPGLAIAARRRPARQIEQIAQIGLADLFLGEGPRRDAVSDGGVDILGSVSF